MDHRRGWAAGVGGAVLVLVAVLAVANGSDGESGASGERARAAAPADPSPTESSGPDGPEVLRPNLRSLPPTGLRIEVAGDQRRLRFAGTLANLGPGPLVLQPRGRGDCTPRQLTAVQVVHVDEDGDGRFRRDRDSRRRTQFAGCMLRHRGHDHWHFDAMAAYSLRDPRADRTLVSRDKVSFCLRDNERVPDALGATSPARREHFGDCTATTRQGISPGWVDVYGSDLDGQWLRVPPGAGDRVLCLDVEADPKGLVGETDEADNAATRAVRLDGTTVRRARAAACA